jgi:hypothetical protein
LRWRWPPARDVGIDVRPGAGLPIVALAKERESELAELTETVARAASGGAPQDPSNRDESRRRLRRRPGRRAPPVAEDSAGSRAEARRRGKKRSKANADAKKPDRIFLPHAKDADPDPPEQRGDVRAAGAARRGTPLRGQLPPRPAPPPDVAVSAVGTFPGIGPGRQRQLLRHFGSIKRVREASVDELASVPGISRSGRGGRPRPLGPSNLSKPAWSNRSRPAEAAAAEEPHAEEQASRGRHLATGGGTGG